jgi:hypothetical protein
MDERESDWLAQLRPYGRENAMRAERCTRLALVLWGGTPDDLRRQLLAPSPELPPGFDLSDFRQLMRRSAPVESNNSRYAWASPSPPPTILVGSQRFTLWEARYEIVRRAIEYLESH